MKMEFIKQYKGKIVKIRTRYSETIIGKLEILDDEYIKIGNAVMKPNVVQQIQILESRKDEEE